MSANDAILGRAPVLLLALGATVLGLGVVMELRGVSLPDMLGSSTAFGVMAKVGGAIAIVGLLLFGLRTMLAETPVERTDNEGDGGVVAEDPLPHAYSHRMADWQKRLAEKASAAVPAPDVAPPRRRFGVRLHQFVLALVTFAFAGLLMLTLWNLLSGPAPSDAPPPVVTSLSDLEQSVAALADSVVADAPSGRAWSEIDLSGIKEWFVAKILLAAAGDQGAIIMLSAMLGVALFAIFGLTLLMTLRRRMHAGRHRNTALMGYN